MVVAGAVWVADILDKPTCVKYGWLQVAGGFLDLSFEEILFVTVTGDRVDRWWY